MRILIFGSCNVSKMKFWTVILIFNCFYHWAFSQSLYISSGETVFVSSGTTLFAGNDGITVNSGGTITINGTLNTTGNISNSGTFSAAFGTLYLDGGSVSSNTSQTVNVGGGMVRFLTIAEGKQVQLTGTLNIPGGTNFGKVLVNTGGKLDANGYLVLKSDANGSAIISEGLVISGVNYLNNNVIVERFIPARRAYRIISPSANTSSSIYANWQESGSSNGGFGTHITGGSGNGFDVTQTNNPSIFLFNNGNSSSTDGTWSALSNTNSTVLTAGTPLRVMVRGDRTINLSNNAPTPTTTVLRTTGVVGQGDITFSSANGKLSNAANAFSLLGNPYPAPVDFKAILTSGATNTNVSSTYFYVWDPQINTRGAYVTVTTSTGNNAVGSNQNHILQPGQSAFVKTASNGSASLTFTESAKADANNNGNGFLTLPPQSILNLRLYHKDSIAKQAPACDALELLFDPSFTNTLNDGDAIKPINQDENLSVYREGKFCSVEQREIPEISEVIDLRISQFRSTSYTFRALFTGDLQLNSFLLDRYTNEYHPLKSEGETRIDFSVNSSDPASIANQRFALVFQNTASAVNHVFYKNALTVYPNPVNTRQIEIFCPYPIKAISLLDLTGKKIAELNPNEKPIYLLPDNLTAGTYWIKSNTKMGELTQPLVVIK